MALTSLMSPFYLGTTQHTQSSSSHIQTGVGLGLGLGLKLVRAIGVQIDFLSNAFL